jgi:putative glutamine amidotransferase
MKLYSASYGEDDPFGLFDSVTVVKRLTDLQPDGALILWGGEDIAPEIYGEVPNHTVFAHKKSKRDSEEMEYIHRAVNLNIPIIGICRGAQLVCAMAGGTLAQHIEGHGRSHMVTLHDEDDVVVQCNSSHHQMMLPPASAVVLASSSGTVGFDQYNRAVKHPRVNEVVYFPVINALGIQPHPEWANCPQVFVDYCVRKIKEHLL